MKKSIANISILLFLLSLSSLSSFAQINLLSEDFNGCAFPTGWSLNIIGDGTPVYDVGLPTNTNSDGSSIDGTCMLIIDDDAGGSDNLSNIVQIISSPFDGTQTPIVELDIDVHWRPYGGSSLNIKVYDGSEFHEVRSWGDGDETGEQFSEFEHVTLDLSFYASANMQLVIEYDDNDTYAWWAGVDNIEIVGKGAGTNVVLENFNGCGIPAGWSTSVQEGNDDWQFGYIDNGNASTNSMNGSCFAYFDDDGIGQNAAFSNALLISPVIDGSQFANFTLDFDLIFRKAVQSEQISVWVFDGTEAQLVKLFSEDVGGAQFNNFENIQLDLSPFRSLNMQVVFAYDDGDDWGWWVGIDNVKIIGDGEINDLCSNAFDLTTGADCINGNNLTALFEGTQPACADNNIAGLWYNYTADFTGILKIETKANFNDVITAFTGDCGAVSELTCINRDEFGFTGEALYMDVVNGTNYKFRVSGLREDFGVPRGELCIKVEEVAAYPITPDNDNCTNAIALQMGNACENGNNLNASFNGPEPSLNLKSRADIWYVFEATSSEEVEILSHADFADVITLYGGTCGSLTEIASNEFGQRLRLSGLTIGDNYYIQIAGYFATLEGSVCVMVQEVNTAVAVNDLCANATELTVGGGCVQGQNISADFDGPSLSCEVYNDANIWYQFTAPASGGVKINTGADFVHSVGVYSGDCNDLTEFLCQQNPTSCEGYFEVGGLVVGQTYFIQIASELNPFGFLGGDLCIDLLDYNSTSDFEPLTVAVNVNCVIDGYGQLEVEASGGVGAYTFQGNTDGQTLETGDEYIVVVTDENNCEVSGIGIVECGEAPCVLSIDVSLLDVSCYGQNNGQIFINVLDGTAPFTYQWSNGASTALVNGLGAGGYSVTVDDGGGCPSVFSLEITEPGLLLANISATGETDSNANDGTVSASPSGGTEPLSYLWSNGATEQNLQNLVPGIYTVTVTDDNGCESIESIVVSDFDCALSLDLVIDEISCNGANDGSVEIVPQGGTAPFTYSWTNGATTGIVTDLEPGTYTVTVFDANGCPWVENITYQEPEVLSLAASEVIPADCNGNSTGTATVLAFGGTGPYTYLWSNGEEGETQSNLAAGNYIVTVIDSRGCNEVNIIEVLEPAVLNPMSINPQDVSCFGSNDGIATIIVSGGTAPFTYQWDDPNGQTTSQASGLSPGTYSAEITDVNGCTGSTTVVIGEPTVLGLTVDAVFDETNSGENGAIEVTVVGGTLPYNYGWVLNGNTISNAADLTDIGAGTYTLVVTDANGCQLSSASIVVDNLVGLSDPELEQFIHLLPNPTAGKFQLHFELQNTETVEITITDVLGRVLVKMPKEDVLSKTFDFDLSEYPAGVYPAKIFVGDKVVLKQVVVQK